MKITDAMKIRQGDIVKVKPNMYDFYEGKSIVLEVCKYNGRFPEYLVLCNGIEVFLAWQRIELTGEN